MVRNYVKKTTPNYTKEILTEALAEIEAGRMTVYRASKHYKIPKNTIHDRIRGKSGKKSDSRGRNTVLSHENEKRLADGILTLEKYGFGLSRKEMLLLVGQFVKKNGLITPFKDGVPGEDWFLGFKKRHNLSLKKAQGVEIARRGGCNPITIQNYFTLLESTIKELNLENSPSRIWNLDETSFCTDPSKTKIVGAKNKPCTRTISAPGKQNITVLLAASATGEKVPPLIIFKGKNIWDEWYAPEKTGFPNTTYAATQNGWMETTVFENYFTKSFLPSIGPDRPVLLIYDGHSTHMSIRLIEQAKQSQVTILKLPPHTTHILQPLDVSVFKSLKSSWDQKLVSWQRKHIGERLSKKFFAQMIGEIWLDLNTNIIVNGFRKTGIYPLSMEVVPDSVFDVASLKQWKEAKQTKANQMYEQMIEEAISQPPIIIELSSVEDQSIIAKENSIILPETLADVQSPPQSSTNFAQLIIAEESFITLPGTSADVQSPLQSSTTSAPLAENCNISFENLLLETLTVNFTEIAKKKKKRVAKGAEVITSEETKSRLFPDKNIKETTLNSSYKEDDNLCCICKCDFRCYTNKKAWIQCVSCMNWVCGDCNQGSRKRQYECERCFDEN